MESHGNGRTAPEDNQPNRVYEPEGKPYGIRFLSRYCDVPASAFSSQPEWIALAGTAFEDWADQIGPAYPGGGDLFLTDSSGAWIKFRRGADFAQGGSASSLPDEAHAIRAAAVSLKGAGEPYVQMEAEGVSLTAVPLYDCGGDIALVIGVSARVGDGTREDGKQVLDWAGGFPAFLYYGMEKSAGVRLAERQQQEEREARKREMLFQMAHELYSKIDTDEILTEIIRRINEFYPDARIDLLMTQDQPRSMLPVKPLRFVGMEEDSCTRAFMEGRIVIDEGKLPGYYEMAIPISGKQGIYGVMHLHSHAGKFEPSDIQIMKVLSGAAGSAFENAKLYEQSNILVNELRLINELTKQLNQSLKMNEIFSFASAELKQIFRSDYCCILQLEPSSGKFIVQATNIPALLHESFDKDAGYSGIVCESKEPVIVSDYWANPNVPSKMMQITGARSLIAAPLLVHDEARGVILVAHRVPGFFTYDNYKLLQVLAGHVGLALANASLHAEVRRMVITDNLTGLYARHYLDEQVGMLQKKDFCGSLIVVDIDHFKTINDTYGHQVGDKILIQVSQIIKSSIRETDIAARWGGEELAIYLPQVMTEQSARIADRIRLKVEKDTEPCVTVSCGVSEWNWQDEKISVESLFYRSDMALYRAKNEGRNCVRVG
ncbi:MAG: diguanylate cyclase [Paenibacillaceae bacterium]|nr:diguanylate cyclase [Paenibacillaceae bacterium]